MHGTRFTDKYLQARQSFTRSAYAYAPALPVRYTDYSTRSSSPESPKASVGSPHSPPRKVVTDFAAFGAPKNASVFGTAVASTPFSLAGGKAAFGGMRNASGGGAGMLDDEEEDDDDGRQRVELMEGSISLEQVRRKLSRRGYPSNRTSRRGASLCRAHGEVLVSDSTNLGLASSWISSISLNCLNYPLIPTFFLLVTHVLGII